MAFPTTGLLARYEARFETGYSSGDPLPTILDQSPAALHAVQATAAKRALWQANRLNGHAAYVFDSVDDAALASTTSAGLTGFTLMAVLSSDATEATSRGWPFVLGQANANTNIAGLVEGNASSEWGVFSRTGGSGTQATINTSGVDTRVWAVLTATWDGTATRLYLNGTQVATGNHGGSFTFDRISLGYFDAIAGEKAFGGSIALAGAWNTALTAPQRAEAHSYVQDTYGITVADYAGGAPPAAGTATGSTTTVGSASGSTVRSGATTGSTTTTGSANGTAPAVAAATGTATGSTVHAGIAAGIAPALGASEGIATGTTAHVGTASGSTDRSGSAAGSVLYVGTASGTAPVVGGASGTAVGQTVTVGTATGTATSTGVAAGLTTITGTATGLTLTYGAATGLTAWSGTAAGSAFGITFTPTPPERRTVIAADVRRLVVPADTRRTEARR